MAGWNYDWLDLTPDMGDEQAVGARIRALWEAPGVIDSRSARLPDDALGRAQWAAFEEKLRTLPDVLHGDVRAHGDAYGRLQELLGELLNSLERLRVEEPAETALRCPRVFISHRQSDVGPARLAARAAAGAGFRYWLDVEDPTLALIGRPAMTAAPAPVIAILAAVTIETALLNCSHVLAVFTDNSYGSLWIPYEYGRVKPPTAASTRCAAWLRHTSGDEPEYMLLGERLESLSRVSTWLTGELAAWTATVGFKCPDGLERIAADEGA